MSAESVPSHPARVTKHRSLRLKFSSLSLSNSNKRHQPSLSISLSPKTPPDHSKSNSISGTKNSNHQRQGSRLMDFIHGTIQKLTLSPTSRSMSSALSVDLDVIDDQSTHLHNRRMSSKSRWKPSLDTIYHDEQLLSALIAFMERSYMDESIRFTQAVHQLLAQIDEQKSQSIQINHSIRSIFELYIASSAQYQVNLSSDCFASTCHKCHPKSLLCSDLETKRRIFDESLAEIERLMKRSVLGGFYNSNELEQIALTQMQQSPVAVSPSPSTPLPIILSMSRSTLSQDDSAMIGTVFGPETPDKDDFDDCLALASPSPLLRSETCASSQPELIILD
eukprot:70711_1